MFLSRICQERKEEVNPAFLALKHFWHCILNNGSSRICLVLNLATWQKLPSLFRQFCGPLHYFRHVIRLSCRGKGVPVSSAECGPDTLFPNSVLSTTTILSQDPPEVILGRVPILRTTFSLQSLSEHYDALQTFVFCPILPLASGLSQHVVITGQMKSVLDHLVFIKDGVLWDRTGGMRQGLEPIAQWLIVSRMFFQGVRVWGGFVPYVNMVPSVLKS